MGNNNVKLYKATLVDASKLKTLRCMLVKENPYTYGDTPEEECAKPLAEYEAWINEYNSQNGAIFLLEIDNKLVGMSALKKDEGDDVSLAYMGSLGVLKEYQGKGYGHRLIDVRLDLAKQLSYKRVRVITTKENSKMVDILKEYGFRIVDEGVYKGIPEYYMGLEL